MNNQLPSIEEAKQAQADNVFSMPVIRSCGHVAYVFPNQLIDEKDREFQANISACFDCRQAADKNHWTADDEARFMR